MRGVAVTGVQTCAIRILSKPTGTDCGAVGGTVATAGYPVTVLSSGSTPNRDFANYTVGTVSGAKFEIGRASCRERGEISVVGGSLKKKKNAAKPVLVSSTTTSEVDGSYSFSSHTGRHPICRREWRSGVCSSELGTDCGAVGGTVATAGYPVTVLSSGSTPNRDFANYTVGTVSGAKF